MSNGKGDTQRPMSVSREQYEENWERAFGKEHGECFPKKRSMMMKSSTKMSTLINCMGSVSPALEQELKEAVYGHSRPSTRDR